MNDALLERALHEAMVEETREVFVDPDLEWRLLTPQTPRRALPLLGVAATLVILLLALLIVRSSTQKSAPAVRPQENAYAGTVSWSSVSFVDATTGYALGSIPVCRQLVAPASSCQPSKPLLRVTHDGGQSWHTVTITQGLTFVLPGENLLATSDKRLYVNESYAAQTFTSGDGGRTFTAVAPATSNRSAGFAGTLVRAGSAAYQAVQAPTSGQPGCPPGIQRLDGATRTTVTQPTSGATAYDGVTAGIDGTLWASVAAKGCSTNLIDGGGQQEVFRSTDAGASWQPTTSPPGNGNAATVTALDADHAWTRDFRTTGTNAPGTDVLHLVRTTDGGRTWISLPKLTFDNRSQLTGPGAGQQGQLVPLSADDLLFTSGTQLYVSHDGGASWRLATQASRASTTALDLQRLSRTTAVALGTDGILRVTTDRGNTWTVRSHLSRVQPATPLATEPGTDPRDVQGERLTDLPAGFSSDGPVQVEGPSEGVSTTTRASTFGGPGGLTLHVLVQTGAHKGPRAAGPSQKSVDLPTGQGVEGRGPDHQVTMTWATPKGNLLVVWVSGAHDDATAASIVEAVARGVVEG